MDFHDVTHLGRSFRPFHHRTHRSASLISIGAALLSFGLHPSEPVTALRIGIGVFAAWVFAREIDPDRPVSATVAAYLTAGGALWLGAPAIGPVFVAAIAARIVSRSTGMAPLTTDLAVVFVGTVWVAATPWGWAAGILLAFAVARDLGLPGEPAPGAGAWGLATAIGVTVRVVIAGTLGAWSAPSGAETAVAVVGILATVFLLRQEPVLSVGDITRTPLDTKRVREARIFGLAPAIVALVVSGSAGVVAMAPLSLSALAVVAVRRGLRGAVPATD